MVKTTVEVDDDLWRRFSLLVLREKGERKKSETIAKLIEEYVEREGLRGDRRLEYIMRLEEEREAFLRMRDELIKDPRYAGRYIAVFRGAVVGCGEDKGKLAEEVYGKYGYVPIYIDRVSRDERRVEAPSPEAVRRGI
ncbi:MAG: hypothetical protein QXR65_08160 [Candidatus Bathyarchaeia archaeon]|nr:hypothetical protein [Candidatus Bathyarchaeota archaeon]